VGLFSVLAGILVLVAGMDPGANAGVVAIPMLLIGAGLGALSSQLGSVTVSSVPDSESAEVGGLQNTGTNLGASLGTALVGSVLLATLTASVVSGIEQNPDVPASVKAQASTQLVGGVPFISDKQLTDALAATPVDDATATAVVEVNASARLDALREAFGVTALLAAGALLLTGRLPRRAPGDDGGDGEDVDEGGENDGDGEDRTLGEPPGESGPVADVPERA
jgi:hypothetical protein